MIWIMKEKEVSLGALLEPFIELGEAKRQHSQKSDYDTLGSAATIESTPSGPDLRDIVILVTRPFFRQYDNDNSGYISGLQLSCVFNDMGEELTRVCRHEIYLF